jgi:3-oxoacyl-[acyl-carrier protein] reductase
MDLELRGRAALLVGAGRGIGAAAALAMAREGCQVALVARSQGDLEARARECLAAGSPAAHALAADATDKGQLAGAIERAASAMGGLDVLVTLVGGSQPGGTADTDDAGWEAAFARNLWPAVRASRLALPHLQKSAEAARARAASAGQDSARAQSAIIHVASIWGREGGGALTYNAAKAALISLAHEQARELATRGVRVCSVAPGSILHPGGSWERRQRADPEAIAAFVQRELPSGRFGTAAEVGEAICFLASPRASWIAGACVVIDGGQSRSF